MRSRCPAVLSPFSSNVARLWEVQDGTLLRFRCRVGHAYSLDSILAGQSEVVEQALWAALKTLEESASLSRRMAKEARAAGRDWVARRFDEKAQEALPLGQTET
ncbi:MAG: hypothetical protein ACJ788_18845 [Ktedonobacteraceae bacterium]